MPETAREEAEKATWDTAKIREAFIYDGGEAEYHDPINGAATQRSVAGAIFDRWLAEHDREVAERAALLSVPETELEELARLIVDTLLGVDWDMPFPSAERLADAILAAGFRKQEPVSDAIQRQIDQNEGMIAHIESNFLPGPNGDAAISEYRYAIGQLRAALVAARAVTNGDKQ